MNVKEYIKSGIVESYVLGMATEAERQEFEQVCGAHLEIAEARDQFERSLETALLQDASEPSASLKEQVLRQIRPAVAESGTTEKVEEVPVRRLNVWKWVAAAAILLLAGTGYWAYTTNAKYNDLLARQSSTERQLQQSTAQLQTLQQDAEKLRQPMVPVALKGTDIAPQAQATIFWDTTRTRDVYMVINNLPQPASDKQYTLWALLDGKPTNLGVFDLDIQQRRLLIRMKNVQNAQAFAISLEQRGNPDRTTPEGQIYVLGNL